MPRPMRSQARPLTRVRRRHRTWMRAMTLATLGWSVIWGAMALAKLGWTAPPLVVYLIAAAPAAAGLAFALMTVRARKAWVFMASVALFANGSLLALPWLFRDELNRAFGG